MENKTAVVFKMVAVFTFVIGGIWTVVSLFSGNPFWFYVLFSAFFAGILNYGIGEGLQLLSDIRHELINMIKVKNDTPSESLVDRFSKGGKL